MTFGRKIKAPGHNHKSDLLQLISQEMQFYYHQSMQKFIQNMYLEALVEARVRSLEVLEDLRVGTIEVAF